MVICSSFSPFAPPTLGSWFSFVSISEVPFGAAGEMGIVSRGTGSELFRFADAGGASSEVDMFAGF